MTTTTTQTETPLPEGIEEAIEAILRIKRSQQVTYDTARQAVRAARSYATITEDHPRYALRDHYRATVEQCERVAFEISQMDV